MLIVISVSSLYRLWPISVFLFKKCMQQNCKKKLVKKVLQEVYTALQSVYCLNLTMIKKT